MPAHAAFLSRPTRAPGGRPSRPLVLARHRPPVLGTRRCGPARARHHLVMVNSYVHCTLSGAYRPLSRVAPPIRRNSRPVSLSLTRGLAEGPVRLKPRNLHAGTPSRGQFGALLPTARPSCSPISERASCTRPQQRGTAGGRSRGRRRACTVGRAVTDAACCRDNGPKTRRPSLSPPGVPPCPGRAHAPDGLLGLDGLFSRDSDDRGTSDGVCLAGPSLRRDFAPRHQPVGIRERAGGDSDCAGS